MRPAGVAAATVPIPRLRATAPVRRLRTTVRPSHWRKRAPAAATVLRARPSPQRAARSRLPRRRRHRLRVRCIERLQCRIGGTTGWGNRTARGARHRRCRPTVSRRKRRRNFARRRLALAQHTGRQHRSQGSYRCVEAAPCAIDPVLETRRIAPRDIGGRRHRNQQQQQRRQAPAATRRPRRVVRIGKMCGSRGVDFVRRERGRRMHPIESDRGFAASGTVRPARLHRRVVHVRARVGDRAAGFAKARRCGGRRAQPGARGEVGCGGHVGCSPRGCRRGCCRCRCGTGIGGWRRCGRCGTDFAGSRRRWRGVRRRGRQGLGESARRPSRRGVPRGRRRRPLRGREGLARHTLRQWSRRPMAGPAPAPAPCRNRGSARRTAC